MEAITREEIFMAAAAGENVIPPEPITRREKFLNAIYEKVAMGGGAVSPEQIEQAVNNYLDNNPVESYTLPVANATTLGGVKPVTATSDMTQDVGVDANGKLFTKPGKVGVDLAMTGAAVGQIAKITAVDASGVPIAWEPVDMPSGGGDDVWELMATVDMVQDATYAQVNLPAKVKKLIVYVADYATSILSVAGSVALSHGNVGYQANSFAISPTVNTTDTWSGLSFYVDFLNTGIKPFSLSAKTGNGRTPAQAYSLIPVVYRAADSYDFPSVFYITTTNGAGVFNASEWYVYGVRA